ncbi:MAG: hypothetical protein CVT84_03925 [Alphaproteobacteria bacterium HGW-Alphaproteobacteria-6]|nr:MAG: hypothetical protein CVT84_03925 [Alphaproteobacteria bacterium HGW-Alphaproteobacteria-6]
MRPWSLVACLAVLSGCATDLRPPGSAPAVAGAQVGVQDVAPPEPAIVAASAQTVAARDYYARIEANYRAQGRLRSDDGGADAPFDAAALAENFARIAFFDEFAEKGGRLVASGAENRLHRWVEPVRLAVEFGASIPAGQRSADRALIAQYTTRLSRLTGLAMRMTGWRVNHTVLVLNGDERRAAGPRLAALAPGISAAAIRSVTDMAPDIYCTVFAFTAGSSAEYRRAVTVIRGELPEAMRLACIHEELAQSLGLVADHPRARPSIFNDNEEFALLTRQDEMMLTMLYDPRLWPGMTLAEARPIIATMAAELIGGDG